MTPAPPQSALGVPAADPLTVVAAGRARPEVESHFLGAAAAPARFGVHPGLDLVAPGADPALRAELERLAAATASAFAADIEGTGRARERLAALRAELGRRGLAAFVVPLTDEYQGEYLPRRAQRLAWLTGFTGSAGVAIVLGDKAAVWSDGRYTLQLREQVDATLYELLHSIEQPTPDWLARTLKAGDRLGYDPWLHTEDGTRKLQQACERAGAELVAVEGNPIDAVWSTQPPAPLGPVQPHELRYAGEGAADKRARVAAELIKAGSDAAVITLPESIAWLLNLRGADVPHTPLPLATAILHADGGVELFIDRRKLTPAALDHLGNAVALHDPAGFADALAALGGARRKVQVDPATSPARVIQLLEAAGAVLRRADDPCLLPKACKNAVELEGTRRAHRRDGAAMTRFLAWLARALAAGEAIDEIAAAERLEAFRRENELIRDLSFPTISGAGPNGAVVHYRVTARSNRRLEPGQLYLVDSGAQYLDGTTDITRTVAIGTPSAEMRDRFTRVLKGHIALATACFPAGTSGQQLDTLARQALWRAGLDYDHGTGHGVGSFLGVHEGPQRIAKAGSAVALKPGMIVSNEPGYYKAGAYGIRIENLVAVRELPAPPGGEKAMLGFETLTRAPIDLSLVEPALLDDAERRWLDDYHARVREELAPLLDAETAAWLAEATRPLGA
jgi:Xaa-Pro aminopeptidase